MRWVSLHSHSHYCKVAFQGIGLRPTPWCERFYPKVDVRGANECWPWKPALKSIAEGKDRLHTNMNFSLRSVDVPFEQMGAVRWRWIAEIGNIPVGWDIDHECEVFYCMNFNHIQIVPALVNQGELNKKRGIYQRRLRGADGRYIKEVVR